MAREYDEDDDDEDEDNPYAPPEADERRSRRRSPESAMKRVKGRVLAPAIGLIFVGSFGLLSSIAGVVIATVAPPAVDPNAPELLQQFQRGQSGPLATVIQLGFVVYNLIIIFGGVQMMRFQMRTLAIVTSVMSILNFGSCCCVMGLPIGIWSLIVLLGSDVADAFEAASEA